MPLSIGDPAPDFDCVAHNGQRVRLADYLGKQPIVLFFYPRDNTSVCTKEACAFRDAYEDFVSAGAAVFGVSGDSLDRHQDFAARQRLPYSLLSDADGRLRRAFKVSNAWGVIPRRLTYVIDRHGVIRHVFSAMFAVDRHVGDALAVVSRLASET